jgi:hypothetical protein
MKRRPSDRKVNYASIVKRNMCIAMVGVPFTITDMSPICSNKPLVGRNKCLTTHER